MQTLNIVHQGLGPIGILTIKNILHNPINDSLELKLVGAIDIKPEYKGKDIGKILKEDHLGIKVHKNMDYILKKTKPDVLVLTTSSTLKEIQPSLEAAINNGINVVSCAEELFYPEFIDKKIYKQLDNSAKKNKVSIIGGGVNPGCLMDVYPLSIIKPNGLEKIHMIEIYRWEDTSTRRESLLNKTGFGMDKETFFLTNKFWKIGHSNLQMQAAYLADNLGFKNYKLNFYREPVIATNPVEVKNKRIAEPGKVIGIHEECKVLVDGIDRIKLDLRLYAGAKNRNSININGRELINYTNIINGDEATARILWELISYIPKSYPGLNKTDYVPDPTKLLVK